MTTTEDRGERFMMHGPSTVLSQCCYCRHMVPGEIWSACPAFPSGLPLDVLGNETDHRQLHPGGQVGDTVFEPRPAVPPATLARLYLMLDGRRA
jgi:hypothetical protein